MSEHLIDADVRKKPDENEEMYVWRLGRCKDLGLIDMSWDELADVMNRELGMTDSPLAEASYRKPYQQARRFYEAGVFADSTDADYLSEIVSERHELEKERVRVRDERTELRRMIREQARKESFREQIARTIEECEVSRLERDDDRLEWHGDDSHKRELVVTFFDAHAGMRFEGASNSFDQIVLGRRISRYLDRVLEVARLHGASVAHVILSELVSGIIHPVIRIESNRNLIEQFVMIGDYVAEFLREMSESFRDVNVYMCPGNHSRLSPNKEEELRGENMDILMMPYLRAKLQNIDNVHIVMNDGADELIAEFEVLGKRVCALHGDKASMSDVTQRLTRYLGYIPDVIYMGHMHTNAMLTDGRTKVIQSGSFMGTGDEYTMNKMLNGRAEQTITVFDESGVVCNYDVGLE